MTVPVAAAKAVPDEPPIAAVPAQPALAPEDCVVLDALGLSPTEASVYLALLAAGPETRLQLQARLGPHLDLVACLVGLEGRGLIRCRPERPPRYEALPPEIAIDGMLIEHAAEFNRLREAATRVKSQLGMLQRRASPTGLVEVVRSWEELDRRYTQLQRAAEREVRAFDRPPYRPYKTPVHNPVEVEEILPKGVVYRAVYDTYAVDRTDRLHDLLAGIAAGEQARVLPELPMKLFIFDDRAAMVPLAHDLAEDTLNEWIVVHPSGLLRALIALFEAHWERALPLRLDGQAAAPAPDHPLSPRNRQILGLVASGLTDEAIARQVRISRSTVQRHIRELMNALGARTRFQAGVQASRRGWL
jgi:DNA-binding CsgD family transcriptional regulator